MAGKPPKPTKSSSAAQGLISDETSREHGTGATSPARTSPARNTLQRDKSQQVGIKIDEEELRAAFEFFDVNGKGKLTPADLKARLTAFYKNLPVREYKFLISEPDFTLKTLTKLLQDNELTNFDPVKEAFKLYDPQETGFVDAEVLRQIFVNLGYGEISPEDLQVLIECADVDGDGRISLEDFRNMLTFNRQKAAATPATGKR
eukprot:tig00001003_g6262.t1